jgi:kynurenine formamidase
MTRTVLWISTAVAVWLGVAAFAPIALAEGDWTQSKWGPADEIGSANYVTPERVVRAAQLVKTGKLYRLGAVTSAATPAFPPREYKIHVWEQSIASSNKITYTDDMVTAWLGVGSQIDGFGHIGVDHVHYNGNKAADFVTMTGLKKFGVENIPPLVARGVLLDMTQQYGVEIVPDGTVFGPAEIEAAAKRQGLSIREGDVVIFHSGWLKRFLENPPDTETGIFPEPGPGVAGARHLIERGVVAIGADTWAVEAIPFEKEGELFPVHQEALAKSGTYLLENMNTAELAADRAYEFMFVLGVPRTGGAVQTIINPVAIR